MKRIKPIIELFYLNSLIFFLLIIALEVNAQTKIIAKSGDTLLKISKQYGIPLKELMYKNNLHNATMLLEGKVILIPRKNNHQGIKSENLTHKVIQGDTLYKIARNYDVKLKDIIAINNLTNNSLLKLDQIIILPKNALSIKEIDKKKINFKVKNVFYHKTSKSEDLSDIANIHKIPIKEIKIMNNLSNTFKVNPNIKLKLREAKLSRWLKYGPLIINWSDWTYLDGNYIAKAKTKNNKSFYLGLNCKKRSLINTLNNDLSTTWYFPENDFEFKLINDFCDQD